MNLDIQYIPRINPHDPDQCRIIAEVAPKFISLSYYDVLKQPKLYASLVLQGRRWFTNQEIYSKIVLDTVAPEKYCEKFNTEKYTALAKALDVEAWMTPDANVYGDNTKTVNKAQMRIALQRTHWLMKENLPGVPVGVLKGTNSGDVIWMQDEYRKMGVNNHILTCGDRLKRACTKDRDILRNILLGCQKNGRWFMMHGITDISFLKQFKMTKNIIVTAAWWTNAAEHNKPLGPIKRVPEYKPSTDILIKGYDKNYMKNYLRTSRIQLAYDSLKYLLTLAHTKRKILRRRSKKWAIKHIDPLVEEVKN